MAIDFTLTSHQRALQLESRKFAAGILENARAAESLPTPEERFCCDQAHLRGHGGGGIFAEMHSSFGWWR